MHTWDLTWHMGWMMLTWIVLPVVVVALLVAALRGSSTSRDSRESPAEVLKRRYASGEIDRTTFEQMLNDVRR